MNQNNLTDKTNSYIVIFLIYVWAIICLTDSLIPLGLYVLIPCAFLLSISCSNKRLLSNRYIKQTLILYAWIAFTGITAVYNEPVAPYFRRLLGVFLFCSTMVNVTTSRKNLNWLYGAYVMLLLSALYYAKSHIMDVEFQYGQDRLNDLRLNANILATYNTYATMSLFLIGEFGRGKNFRTFFRICFLFCIPLSFVIAILTGSRQVLLIQTPLILLLLYLRYLKNAKVSRKILVGITVAIAVSLSISSIQDSYNKSLLKRRNEVKIEQDGRYYLLMHAIEVGNEYPIFGVGPNNYARFTINGGFSHCSYAEVYANHGVVGLLIFIWILFSFCKLQLKRYYRTKSKLYLIFFSFGLIFSLYNILYVFYFDIWLWSFFVLIGTHSDFLYSRVQGLSLQKNNNT